MMKNLIARLDEFTARQGIVSGEWCKLLDILERETGYQESKIKALEDEVFDLKKQVITELSEKLKLAEKALSNHSCVHAPLNDYNCHLCETLEMLQKD